MPASDDSRLIDKGAADCASIGASQRDAHFQVLIINRGSA